MTYTLPHISREGFPLTNRGGGGGRGRDGLPRLLVGTYVVVSVSFGRHIEMETCAVICFMYCLSGLVVAVTQWEHHYYIHMFMCMCMPVPTHTHTLSTCQVS